MHRLILLAALGAITTAAHAAEAPDATTSSDGALCADTPRQTVADMRIEESDLDQAAALAAADRLRARIAQGELSGDVAFGVFNALKVLEGHVLREQALATRREAGPDTTEARAATDAFCAWLAEKGFWYD